MGIVRSCFGQPSPERLPKEDIKDHRDVGLTTSVIEFFKRSCSWGKNNEIKKMQLPHPQEKQHQQHKNDQEFSTLGECLLSSPVLSNYSITDGEVVHHHVVKQNNKVYPSFAEGKNADCATIPRGSFSKQRLLEVGAVDSTSREVDDSTSLSKSKSGKVKKRVSFKLLEEADIFFYNIADEEIDE